MAIAGVRVHLPISKMPSAHARQSVLHHLATHTLALSCFATHYSSLTDDFVYHPNIRNMHMQTMVDDEKREVYTAFPFLSIE